MLKKSDKYIILFLLSCCLVSVLPVLTLELYEFAFPFMWTMKYLAIPVSAISVFTGYRFFMKIMVPALERTNKKMNRFLGVLLFASGIFLGLIFAIVNGSVFCNAFIGKQTKIDVPVVVIKTYGSSANRGKTVYHHVLFQHPFQDRLVDMYVKRNYQKDDTLDENLMQGSLSLLYSK